MKGEWPPRPGTWPSVPSSGMEQCKVWVTRTEPQAAQRVNACQIQEGLSHAGSVSLHEGSNKLLVDGNGSSRKHF